MATWGGTCYNVYVGEQTNIRSKKEGNDMSSMSSQKKDNKLEGLEPIVELYQATGDERFFNSIVDCFRHYLQGRAYLTSSKFGLDEQDCESTLMVALFDAVESYDNERSVPFDVYVKMKFKYALNKLFFLENRDNHFFGPSTCRQDFVDYSNRDLGPRHGVERNYQQEHSNSIQMVYGMGLDDSFNTIDYRQDVANLIADEDAAERLLEAIRKVDITAADVVSLTALGYSKVEVAKILRYVPEVPSPKPAQINWVSRRLDKCIKPAQKYYSSMGRAIPIKLKK